MSHLPYAILLSLFPALVIVAALRDATSYLIPNWISLALVAAFPAAALVCGLVGWSLGAHLLAGLVALILGLAMFALGWIGGGDAKLFAVAGLWLGWPAGAAFLLVTALAGGGLAVSLLGLRSLWLQPLLLGSPNWFARLATPGENVPYGVAIAVGALFAFPQCDLMQALGL